MSQPDLIGVCGAGTMGAGIAQVAARAGHPVVVFDTAQPALDRAAADTSASLQKLAARGRLSAKEAEETIRRIHWSTQISALSSAALVIEAIVENADAKASLFDGIEAVIGDDAILATNTSSLSVTRLGASRKAPGRFLGLHFFNPAPVMKLVEVIPGRATSPAVTTRALDMMSAWGKSSVQVRDVPGFIVNRVARAYYAEGFRAYEEQAAAPEVIDALFREGARFRMGPLELADMIGHDVNFAVACSVYDAYFGHCRFVPSLAQSALVDAGRLGRKTGRGVFDYSAPRPVQKAPSKIGSMPRSIKIGPGVDAILKAQSEKAGGVVASIAEGSVEIDGVLFRRSDGRMAATVAAEFDRPVAVLDWATGDAQMIAFTVSDPALQSKVEDLIAALGVQGAFVHDRPGLIVLRTLGQLANAAGDAVRDRIADAAGVDEAMKSGANYPLGPLDWAKAFGHEALISVMTNIAREAGEPIYQPSVYFRQRS